MREATLCLNWEHRAQRVATLEDTLLQTIQRIARLEEENTRLHQENARLQQQLAAA